MQCFEKWNILGSKVSNQRLFVAISSRDVNMNSQQSRDADRMCCFFQDQGLEVTYTMWHTTELSQTNVIQWVTDHVDDADHVILVVTAAALGEQEVQR